MRTRLFATLALLLALPLSVTAQIRQTGILTKNAAISLDVAGQGTASITVAGTYSGTINFEVVGGAPGSPAVAASCTVPSGGSTVSSTTSTGTWVCSVAGLAIIQARMSSYVSGAAEIGLMAAPGGGGGGGSASGSVSITQDGNTAAVNASSQLSVTCANCSGSGVSVLEDAASAGGDAGTPAYSVRNDTLTGATSANGDYAPLKSTAAGALYAALTFGDTVAAVNNGAVSAQTQRVTIANDSTGVLASVGAVGSITNALPAGTNAIGKLAANSGVDIGDVDVTSIIPGVGATNLGKTEDAAHSTGDTGAMLLAVRNDAGTALAGTTGDYIPLSTDANGALRVAGSAGTTQYAEDVATASGDSMVFVGAVRRDTTPASSSGTAGDYSAINVDANGRLYTQAVLYNSTGTEITPATDVAEDAAESNGVTGPPIMTVRRDTAASSAGTAGDYATINTDALGRLWTRSGDPCADHARLSSVVISTASSGNVELVALNSGDIVYVCGYDVVATGAVAVQFIYGTGTACGTGETDLTGAMPFAANGGISVANTGALQFKNAVSNALCIELSAAVQVDGILKYVRTAAP